MAAIDTTRPAMGFASVAMRPGKLITNVMARVTVWNDARTTRNALGALSDRELADIGLIRGDIDLIGETVK